MPQTIPQPDDALPLTAVLRSFIDKLGWEDELIINYEEKTSQLATTYVVDDQRYRLYFDADDERSWMWVSLYSPINVSARNLSETCLLLAELNNRTPIGRFATNVSEPGSPIQFRVACDIEGSAPTITMLSNMLAAAGTAFEKWMPAIAQVALAGARASDVLKDVPTTLH